jgi:hemin uptake protein HemP
VSPTKAAEEAATPPRKVQSDSLLGEAKELLILHNGREYRLRLTQNGKLILTA